MSLDSIYLKVEEKLGAKGKPCLVGIWTDEHKMISAATQTREHGCKKFDTITPFPMHEVDEAVGLKRSWIPWVTFAFGMFGLIFGIWFTWWTSAVDWALNIGGKPMWSLPAFIPVIFELVILFAALSSVATCFIVIGLPKLNPPVIDPDLTCHKFGIYVPEDDSNFDKAKLEKIFKDNGAEDVRMAEF